MTYQLSDADSDSAVRLRVPLLDRRQLGSWLLVCPSSAKCPGLLCVAF